MVDMPSRQRTAKRSLDLPAAIFALVLCLPVLILIGVAVGITMGRPILFRQRRPGLLGRAFVIYKFRTMSDVRDANGRLLPDADRLTRFGRLLRSTSLDELPELFNVLRGDMSLVGPRPLRMEYLGRYSPRQARRHEVKPGITGWAQINGRNAVSWEERFELDVWYVDNWNLALDLRILLTTVRKVLGGAGINAPSHATMPEFMGSAPANEHIEQHPQDPGV